MRRWRPSRARCRHAWRAGRDTYRTLRPGPRPSLRALLRYAFLSQDGVVVAIVMVVAVVAAAAIAAYASYEQGQAQKKAYKYNAKVAENQAAIAKQQQDFAARQQRERDKRLRAVARARLGATGVEVGEGSSLLVDIENARSAELNAAAARYSGQAIQSGLIGQSLLSRYQGDVAEQQGNLGAIAAGVGGVASAAGGYSRMSVPQSSTQPTGIQVPDYAYP